MANQEHLDLLKQGTDVWNLWRKQHPDTRPDLSNADLSNADLNGAILFKADLNGAILFKANLSRADLSEANLGGANLFGTTLSEANLMFADLSFANLGGADLSEANLSFANLSRATIFGANLGGADLSEANLSFANLGGADLSWADLGGADLSEANLRGTTLVATNLTDAVLTGCYIYGIAAWNVELKGATQDNLVITPEDEPTITVDNLKIAQFIYLLLNNQEIRDIIDTIAKKAVLILGRFTPKRKAILDALRDELRKHDYLPILFDFDKPSSHNFTETIRTLARLSRFIIADLTDPSSMPQELYAIAPTLTVPIQPLLETSRSEYGMFSDLSHTYHWILPIYRYTSLDSLLSSFQRNIIDPAEHKAQELIKQKAQELTQQ